MDYKVAFGDFLLFVFFFFFLFVLSFMLLCDIPQRDFYVWEDLFFFRLPKRTFEYNSHQNRPHSTTHCGGAARSSDSDTGDDIPDRPHCEVPELPIREGIPFPNGCTAGRFIPVKGSAALGGTGATMRIAGLLFEAAIVRKL